MSKHKVEDEGYRIQRIAEIRAQLAAGSYETPLRTCLAQSRIHERMLSASAIRRCSTRTSCRYRSTPSPRTCSARSAGNAYGFTPAT